MNHPEAIEAIAKAMIDVAGVKALFLSGSYGNGLADAFSDIDFVLITDDGATDEMAAAWRAAISTTGPIVLWWDRTNVPVLINAITQDWTRYDVIILKPDQLKSHTQDSLKPVFDHAGLYDGLMPAVDKSAPNLGRFRYTCEEFIRILGLLHLALGREEFLTGVLGVFHLRNLLVELLKDETDAPNRGGVLHLNRLITDEQKALLYALPPAVPDRDRLIDVHLAYAKAFLPRARKRAELLGVEWPEAFEAATWAKLEESLQIKRPY